MIPDIQHVGHPLGPGAWLRRAPLSSATPTVPSAYGDLLTVVAPARLPFGASPDRPVRPGGARARSQTGWPAYSITFYDTQTWSCRLTAGRALDRRSEVFDDHP